MDKAALEKALDETASETAAKAPAEEGEKVATPAAEDDPSVEKVEFKVIYNKKKYDITFPAEDTVGALKAHLHPIIAIRPEMMKVMIKGLAKDEMSLKKLGVKKGSKVMVIGSSIDAVLAATKMPTEKEMKAAEVEEKAAEKEKTLSTIHKKILDKGKPDDVMPGYVTSVPEPLPTVPLSGMLNKRGGKVRLTFKMDQDQVWIGTKERTEKIGLNSIKDVVSESIKDHPGYHILALQLGPTEASRYWIYWVPAQYVEAIKEAVLGKWQSF